MGHRKNYNRVSRPHESIEFNGLRFLKRESGHYIRLPNASDKGEGRRKPWSLHVAIWEFRNGPLPEGHVIHHIDHDASNNPIDGSNFKLMTVEDHNEHHRLDRKKKRYESQPALFEYEKVG